MMIKSEVNKFYDDHGYFVAKNILPLNHIESIEAEIKQIFFKQIEFINQTPVEKYFGMSLFDLMKVLFNLDQTRYLSCLHLIPRLYNLQLLMMHPIIEQYVKKLGVSLPVMQSRNVFHVMSNELKFRNGYFGFEAHQDWPSIQSSLDMVVVWIPLVDVDFDLFPVELIPGSHLKGLCKGGVAEHITSIDHAEYNEDDFIKIPAKRGDVVFMSGFTIHRSAKSGRDNDIRIASSCRYENAMEKHVIAHAYPYCQKNIVKRDLIIDGFPDCEQVREVFK